jgi:hypothetical protein
MKRANWTKWALPLVGAVLLTSCASDDEHILGTPGAGAGGALFERYVSIGNSITAGYQSGGINDSTQLRAYPVLVANQAGAVFGLPLLNKPGCPPPLLAPFSTARVGGPNAPECALRRTPVAPLVQNLAVPGAVMASATNSQVAANALTTFILGGRTPVEAMQQARPTLVSAWLGNNEVLGAALQGDPSQMESVAQFTAALDALVAGIKNSTAQDAILMGAIHIPDAPALQPGAFAWLVKQNPQTAPLLPNPVSDNCAPVNPATGQPNPLSRNLVSLLIVGRTIPGTSTLLPISCANDAPFVLTPAEQAQVTERVATFNALIKARAEANNWIYFDPNDILIPSLADPSALRNCQGLATAQTMEQIVAAVQTTCPSPDPAVGFGSLISYDGAHPSSKAHALIANALIKLINTKHSLAIPTI